MMNSETKRTEDILQENLKISNSRKKLKDLNLDYISDNEYL
jgi:hypothetical protein